MCTRVNKPSDIFYGEIRQTCNEPVKCLLKYVGLTGPGAELFDEPARKVFERFTSVAKTFVVELSYFDLDYRSEFSRTYETSFGRRNPEVYRLHFFATPAKDQVHLRDYVELAVGGYLGYSIIRPNAPGTIGRSMIPPIAEHEALSANTQLSDVVRTAVTERVQLFGIWLTTTGVPFMEQDGHIMRCAHVSAWICHFSAVLRGTVTRRPTASFNLTAQTIGTIGRPYPAEGLTFDSLSSMLSHVDLPGELISPDQLLYSRKLTWADRSEFTDRLAADGEKLAPYEDPGDFTAADVSWVRENLTSIIRRYLNSGIPSIICRTHIAHTQAVVGYARHHEVAVDLGPRADPNHFDIVAFLASDDAEDPFCLVPIADVVDEICDPAKSSAFIVVPLPRGLWLSGDIAEDSAIDWFTESAAERSRLLASWEPLRNDSGLYKAHKIAMDDFLEGTRGAQSKSFAIRTYAIDGADFKESIAQRFVDDSAFVRKVGQMQLPKYLWVCEAIDRELRKEGKAAVKGTIAIDATTIVRDRSGPSAILPLFAHIPGQSYVKPPYALFENIASQSDWLADLDDIEFEDDGIEDAWQIGRLEPTASGRWKSEELSPERIAHKSKGASSGP